MDICWDNIDGDEAIPEQFVEFFVEEHPCERVVVLPRANATANATRPLWLSRFQYLFGAVWSDLNRQFTIPAYRSTRSIIHKYVCLKAHGKSDEPTTPMHEF
jgi:hypothetical protein